jgi:transmembrane sensor
VDTSADSDREAPLPESVRAEAAVWVARLHCDARTEQTEAGFRRWLAEKPCHRPAFERMTNTWEATAGLRRVLASDRRRSQKSWNVFSHKALAAAATLAVCALFAFGAVSWIQTSGHEPLTYATAIGERRSLLLPDGSRLILNTQSRVLVSFTSGVRRITLDRGQARFEVAHDAARPFVVRAGGRQVVALGTAFDVRWTDERLSVVLFKGQVVVLPDGAQLAAAQSSRATTLLPGERLVFERPDLAVKSTVRIEREEAWVSGRVVFESTPLASAVAEINRYAPQRIVLADPTLATLEISGTFSVDDAGAFARAVAQMFSLDITNSNGSILLTRRPDVTKSRNGSSQPR